MKQLVIFLTLVVLPWCVLSQNTTCSPTNYTLSTNSPGISCEGGSATLTLSGSDVGAAYQLWDSETAQNVGNPVPGTGSALDFVVNSPGTYSVRTEQAISNTLLFDGIDDFVGIDNTAGFPLGNDPRTMECWVKTSASTNGVLVDYGNAGIVNNRSALLVVNGQLFFAGESNDLQGSITINDGQWHHVAVTHDGTTLRLYVDGVADGSKVTTLATSGTDFKIGQRSNLAFSEAFNGELNRVRIWNTAFDAAATSETMNACITGTENNLVVAYNFFENTGSTLQDAKGGINGTLTNMDIQNAWQINPAIVVDISNAVTLNTEPSNLVFVDLAATGLNNGCSWENAFTNVQDAVDAVVTGGEIRIAEGIYQQGAEVLLNKSLTIKGGYPEGGGVQNIDSYPTILDGEDSYRVLTLTHASADSVVIEGITVQHGNATEGGGMNIGTGALYLNKVIVTHNAASLNSGGIYVNGGRITIESSQVKDNAVFIQPDRQRPADVNGGGIYALDASIILIDSKVNSNSATAIGDFRFTLAKGGGIYASRSSIVSINSEVTNNTVRATANELGSLAEGGGIYASYSFIDLVNAKVGNNTVIATSNESGQAVAEGGGIYSDSTLMITNSTVIRNACITSARVQGAHQYVSTARGGGINNQGTCTAINSQITSNLVRATIDNSNFNAQGGGVFGPITLINSILWGNTHNTDLSISRSNHDGESIEGNNIVREGFGAQDDTYIDATAVNFTSTNFIDVENGNFGLRPTSTLINGGNNAFLPADVHDLDHDGDTTETIPFTLGGNERILDNIVDIGPFEWNFAGKHYNTSATAYYFDESNTVSVQDGLSWGTAFSSLNDYFHIQDTSNVNTIYLAKGNYPISSSLYFPSDIDIKGGYNALTGQLEEESKSIIDAQFNGRVVWAEQNINLHSIHVKNGLLSNSKQSSPITNAEDLRGGGIYAGGNIMLNNSEVSDNSISSFHFSPTITPSGGGLFSLGSITMINCRVINNRVSSSSLMCGTFNSCNRPVTQARGGGIFSTDSLTMVNCQVMDNEVSAISLSFSNTVGSGGGIHSSGFIRMDNSKVLNNAISTSSSFFTAEFNNFNSNPQSTAVGGGIYALEIGDVDSIKINMFNSQVINNEASAFNSRYSNANAFGGGIGIGPTASMTMVNCLVKNNAVVSSTDDFSGGFKRGGGIYSDSNPTTAINSLITGNTVVSLGNFNQGGGVYGPTVLKNSILRGNYVMNNNEMVRNEHLFGSFTPINSLWGFPPGFDPLFVDEANGDFHLQAGSPLINLGNDAFNTTNSDFDNNARFVGTIDIGPYEFNGAANANTSWTGATNTLWQEPGNWNNGVPDANSNVNIPTGLSNYPAVTNASTAHSFNLDNQSGASITVSPGQSLVVENTLNNEGTMTVQSGGSLVTYGTVSDGDYLFERETTFDENTGRYSVLGSPITNGQIMSLGSLVFQYDEAIPYESGASEGLNRYIRVSANETMTPGQGYFSAFTGTVQFNGTPNFGDVTIPIARTDHSTLENDMAEEPHEGFNLVANPYPAAISLDAFLNGNPDIEGTVWIWDDGGSDTQRRANSDFLTINRMGVSAGGSTRGADWNGHIGAMQGFFIRATADGTLGFADSMKVVGSNADGNFFRPENNVVDNDYQTLKLSLTDDEDGYYETLVGFTDKATNEFDRNFDAPLINNGATYQLYSVLDGQRYAIQAGSLEEQRMQLGIKVPEGGHFQLHLAARNIPEREVILLTDLLENKTHDFRTGSYAFSSLPEEFTDRFLLEIGTVTHSENSFNAIEGQFSVYGHEGLLTLSSATLNHIEEMTIYDLSGSIIQQYRNISLHQKWSAPVNRKGIVLVQIKSSEGIQVNKLLFR